jgi:hypothetical protein
MVLRGLNWPWRAGLSMLLGLTVLIPVTGPVHWTGPDNRWIFGMFFAVLTAIAAFCITASRPWLVSLLIAPIAPLAYLDVNKFLILAWPEPSGLLGLFAWACGFAVLVAVDPDRVWERSTGMLMVAFGSCWAAAARVGFVLILAVGFLAMIAFRPRMVAVIIALLSLTAMYLPLDTLAKVQQALYGEADAHNVTFQVVGTEVGPEGLAQLGYPPAATQYIGDSYDALPDPSVIPGWNEILKPDPAAARNAAVQVLANHPQALANALSTGWAATTRPDLQYLVASQPEAGHGPGPLPPEAGVQVKPLKDALGSPLHALILTLVSLAGLALRNPFWRLAGLVSLSASGVVATAVLGQGYYQLPRNVWLAAYGVEVITLLLVGAGLYLFFKVMLELGPRQELPTEPFLVAQDS